MLSKRAAAAVGDAVLATLPSVRPQDLRVHGTDDDVVDVDLGHLTFRAAWIGQGRLADVARWTRPAAPDIDVVVGRMLSAAAREAAIGSGLGWLDASGAGEVALPGLIISRVGVPPAKPARPPRWSPSALGVAEAVLLGVRPTVADIVDAAGISAGGATNALAWLSELGLLGADAARGRGSARYVTDRRALLTAYADAANGRPAGPRLEVGVVGDLVDELSHIGKAWERSATRWGATGAVAGSILAPYLSEVNALEVYVRVPTKSLTSLAVIAEAGGVRPIEGGRLILRPFPSPITDRLSTVVDGIRVVPWPRVYADLRDRGVRGEESAEHLAEVVGGI